MFAIATLDYREVSTQLTFGVVDVQCITIPIVNDLEFEGQEEFLLVLQPEGDISVRVRNASVFIIDNDGGFINSMLFTSHGSDDGCCILVQAWGSDYIEM